MQVPAKDAKIVMSPSKLESFGFQYSIEIDKIALVRSDGLVRGLTFVLEVFEESPKPGRELGEEIHVI